jgi:hypothetical protein
MAGLDDNLDASQGAGGAGSGGDPNAPRRAAVTGYYQNILKRAPDDAGLNGWVNSGLDLGQIQQAFYNSDEYKGMQSQPSTPSTPSTPTPPAGTYDDSQLRNQIAQWAAMPGADPSLAKDPDYWVGAINSRGGLSSSNLQYWQDAGVGPSAFFNNPNREQAHTADTSAGAPSAPGAGGPGNYNIAYTPPPRDPRWDALYNQLLTRSQQSLTVDPNDPAIKAQTDAFRANANTQRLNDMQTAAERGGPYATGLVGNIARTTSEHVGDSTSQFLGTLLGNEVTARRKEIADALSQMGSQLSADEVNQLHIADQQLAAREAEINAQYAQQNFTANQNQQAWEDWFKQYVYGTGGGA